MRIFLKLISLCLFILDKILFSMKKKHPAHDIVEIVFGLGKNLLFKSALGHCVTLMAICLFLRDGYMYLLKPNKENGSIAL